MKNFPSALTNLLLSKQPLLKADLMQIRLASGYVMNVTDGQTDITAGTPPTLYSARKFGAWERGSITTERSFAPKSNDMTLSVNADGSSLLPPQNLPLFQCVTNGLFDKAQVIIYTLYCPIPTQSIAQAHPYSDAYGLELKFVGDITAVTSLTRIRIEFSCSDLLFRLNLSTPPRLIQSSCPYTVGDANCGVNLAAFTDTKTAASGSTQLTIFPNTAFAFGSALGIIRFTSGSNAGLSQKIRQINGDGSATLDAPMILPVHIGDIFTATKGCNQDIASCTQFFGSVFGVHFGGMPFVPTAETVL